jgi:hypothetical protein
MSFLFTLDEAKLTEQLPEIFEGVEREIAKAEPLFDIEGVRLELLARDLPKHQGHYDLKAQEMKQLMKWLENYKGKQEAILLKNYNKGQRALSATDQRILIGGEKDIVETNQLIIEATLLYGKLDSIVEAFKQMGWMIGHITKLRVAELGDIII